MFRYSYVWLMPGATCSRGCSDVSLGVPMRYFFALYLVIKRRLLGSILTLGKEPITSAIFDPEFQFGMRVAL
jgi:hypothetical protein